VEGGGGFLYGEVLVRILEGGGCVGWGAKGEKPMPIEGEEKNSREFGNIGVKKRWVKNI